MPGSPCLILTHLYKQGTLYAVVQHLLGNHAVRVDEYHGSVSGGTAGVHLGGDVAGVLALEFRGLRVRG